MLRLSNFLNIKKYFLFYTFQTIPKNRLACYLKPKPNHFLDNISVKVSHPNRWKPLSITVTVMESAFLEELREGSHFFHLQTGADVRAYARSTRHPKDLKQNRMKICLCTGECASRQGMCMQQNTWWGLHFVPVTFPTLRKKDRPSL